MTHVSYEVIEHDGAWAYRVGDVCSETFATRREAHEAAERAAAAHRAVGEDETVEYQDSGGVWRQEDASGADRPKTEVRD